MSTDPAPRPVPGPATAPITISPSATSKKRSHQEISPEDEPMEGTLPPSRTPAISPEAIYSERIPRINPLTGTATTAETQTGRWFEDQLERQLEKKPQSNVEEMAVQQMDFEGDSPKRKVQRRDTSSNADVTMAANPTESPKATIADPTIDQYTHLLGIGWTNVGEDSGLVAMARGFSRFIENHYPLTNADIVLKSKSLESYLVKTGQGYYLFPEDLMEGRLVAKTWEETLANLKISPPRLSWAQPLIARRTPGKETPETGRESNNGTGSSALPVEDGDIEMD